VRALRVLIASWLIVLGGSTSALAHGDPSSHYLEAESLYPAFGDRPSQATELALLGVLQATAERGYPIKVALVANEDDLTDDPSMLRKPQAYAQYVGFALERELQAPVLVVTPHGFGVAGSELRGGRLRYVTTRRAGVLVRGLQAPGEHGEALARAAIAAVRRLADAGGHALPANVPPARTLAPGTAVGDGGGVGRWTPAIVGALVFLLAWLGYELWTRVAVRTGPAGPDIRRRSW
jgi:hypothetical protein